MKFIGRQKERDIIKEQLQQTIHSKGSFIIISGESGYGKTSLVQEILQEIPSEILVAHVACSEPVGGVDVSAVQPFMPLRKALSQFTERVGESARKRLLVNIGMTVAGMIPVFGDFIYGIKEIRRDLKEYKQESQTVRAGNFNDDDTPNALAEIVVAFERISEQQPIAIFLDNAQFADAQTISALQLLSRSLKHRALMIVLCIRSGELRSHNPILERFVEKLVESKSSHNPTALHLTLGAFSTDEIFQVVAHEFTIKSEFPVMTQWIWEHSAGVPSVVTEYIRFFHVHPPFDEDKKFAPTIGAPETAAALLERVRENLSEDDKALLAIAAVEGRECTVWMVAQLLNLDALRTVRSLKSLAERTGLLRSRGAEIRYGVKTTVFEFTQAHIHALVIQSLEFEELEALHTHMADILRRQFEKSTNQNEREQIAPYLLAHDEEYSSSPEILMELARNAERFSAVEAARYLAEKYEYSVSEAEHKQMLEMTKNTHLKATIANAELASQSEQPDWSVTKTISSAEDLFSLDQLSSIRTIMQRRSAGGKSDIAAQIGEQFYEKFHNELLPQEQVDFETLLARCYLTSGNISKAQEMAISAQAKAQEHSYNEFLCLTSLIIAETYKCEQQYDLSLQTLQSASELALGLGVKYQFVVIKEIADVLEQTHSPQAKQFRLLAQDLEKTLQQN